tara:strand:- start:223 stop:609 length:387 start_codon:yes stop_codon:yes gene_type:complete
MSEMDVECNTHVVVAVRDEIRAIHRTKITDTVLKWSCTSMCIKSVKTSMDKIQFVGHMMLFMQGKTLSSISLLDSYPIPVPVACPCHWGDGARFYSMCNDVLAVSPNGNGLYRLMKSCGGVSAMSVYC